MWTWNFTLDHRNLLRGCSEDQHGVKAKYHITRCSKKTYLEELLQRQGLFQGKIKNGKILTGFFTTDFAYLRVRIFVSNIIQ